MKFDALPSQCLVDETLSVRVVDLQPDARLRLTLKSRFNDLVLRASASFTADARGIVDLSRQAPDAGSYEGVDAMGLFWSRAPVAGEAAEDAEAVSQDPLTATLTAEAVSSSISHDIRRVYVGPGVSSREVREQGLVGRMFEPAGPGPRPAVLVVGGSAGGLAWSQEMAALLASHGYSCFS